jgi:glycosyltransferase involved in cell wall biosynthesis
MRCTQTDPMMAEVHKAAEPRRITLVADELRGLQGGGIGTATTYLAIALGRMGHEVEVLYVGDQPRAAISSEWTRLYDEAGVRIRTPARSGEPVDPRFFGRMLDIERALQTDSPDVVIVQDLAAPAYTALRSKHLGLAFEDTLFVVYCHGTRQWITDTARKVRVLPGALAVNVLEQASVELADVVVSPSAYLVEWMGEQGWRLPAESRTIPYVTRSGATDDNPRERMTSAPRVERVVFFGRFEERKGIRPFLDGLNALEAEVLRTVQLEFMGKTTRAWPRERIQTELTDSARRALRRISFETDLDQSQALDRLSRPGTLAVMPSLEDNSPNTVYECLERSIPFLASNTGGIPELVAPEDRARVLFEPTPQGIAQVLRRALSDGVEALRPAQPAFDEEASLAGWAEVIGMRPRARRHVQKEEPAVDVIVVDKGSSGHPSRCLVALDRQSYHNFRTTVVARESSVEAARQTGLETATAPWLVFLDADDEPFPEFLETLVRAQQASGADVVSCGFYAEENGRTLHLFAGEPRGLGVLENGYGQAALLRRSALTDPCFGWPIESDPDWPVLARLSARGAKIVSVPAPLLTCNRKPGAIERCPSDALLVAKDLERELPEHARSLARLAAGLAADAVARPGAADGSIGSRLSRVLREEGVAEALRTAGGRLRRRSRGGA